MMVCVMIRMSSRSTFTTVPTFPGVHQAICEVLRSDRTVAAAAKHTPTDHWAARRMMCRFLLVPMTTPRYRV
jgi:hypothetical protein